MVHVQDQGIYLVKGKEVVIDDGDAAQKIAQLTGQTVTRELARQGTIAHGILMAHNTVSDAQKLRLRFDALTSHDITYVGIIQTARASGLTKFPMPYVLTNCHNSLCAVGGTINEDDHQFALSAARKFGGIYVPAHLAVIHQYMRECMAGCGKMILGSDSHTRYGALGTMAIGEGGGELAKQLLNKTYDVTYPGVVAVRLSGKPNIGVGPQDVALAIIGAVFERGYVKNKVMEFVGDGIANLSVEYRNGIDVMTTETTCLSSIWRTDDQVKDYLAMHGRAGDYKELAPADIAYYDGCIDVDLSAVVPMIALPFHPSNVYTIDQLNAHGDDILAKVEADANRAMGGKVTLDLRGKLRDGRLMADQAVVAGCAGGTYDNIVDVADILRGKNIGHEAFTMSVYPSSQPTYFRLVENGSVAALMQAGVVVRSAFCGPCFGAGDTPANGAFSIRHATRNFPNREGSKPNEGQLASVALMDARSVAATAANGGRLTSATELTLNFTKPAYAFSGGIYQARVFDGYGHAEPETELRFGPNIADWPRMPSLTDDVLLRVASFITDPVTTTDELIPSGETSSFRSNPERLSEFTLSRKDPGYVGRAKTVRVWERAREAGQHPERDEAAVRDVCAKLTAAGVAVDPSGTGMGSMIYALRPGDGSAREQAASCQRVLGGWANIAREYATKRYRSNLINWGVLPFTMAEEPVFALEDFVFVRGVRAALQDKTPTVEAYAIGEKGVTPFTLTLTDLTDEEHAILMAGCLINYYK